MEHHRFFTGKSHHLFGCSVALLRWSNPECKKKYGTAGFGARTCRGESFKRQPFFETRRLIQIGLIGDPYSDPNHLEFCLAEKYTYIYIPREHTEIVIIYLRKQIHPIGTILFSLIFGPCLFLNLSVHNFCLYRIDSCDRTKFKSYGF